MALTANREVDHYIDQELRAFPVAAAAHIYKGALVGVGQDGFVRGLIPGDRLCGIAYEEIDNTAGGSGAITVRVYTQGDFALALTGVSEIDALKEVYAVDDQNISLSAGPRIGFVGHVLEKLDTNLALVRLTAPGVLPADDHAAQIQSFEDFLGAEVNTTDGPWKKIEVGAATGSAVTDAHAGEYALTLTAASGAEDAVLYQGDRKTFDIDSELIFECRAKVVTPGTGTTVVFGLAGDHNLDKDTVAQNVWFRLQGGMDLLVESDDGTTDIDDIDTTVNLVSGAYGIFRIDLTDPADVRFYMNGQRLASTTTFDMSAFTGRLQPYFSLDKASGTGAATLTLDWVRVTATRS
ncbi:MAG: hypothetical protein ACE5GE_01845 [Phycisphaerae bacterium]